jgi:glucosyl-3-phosphoglycerate phosphatase
MRHGTSEGNQKRIIVSLPENGVFGYGLTEEGKKEVEISVGRSDLVKKTPIIYTSDFLRARETAFLLAKICSATNTKETSFLRERSFGELEGKSDDLYHLVWEKDKENINNRAYSVESPLQVKTRVLKLVDECENRHFEKTIVFVSHGDTLQIMQAVFSGLEPNLHRSMPHLKRAEIRCLQNHSLKSNFILS